MNILKLPTQKELHELFDYQDGVLIWKISKPGVKKGNVAGSFHKNTGYIRITINNKLYHAHRIVWRYHGKRFNKSKPCLDHIDGVKTNNRIENLRLATKSENSHNSKNRKNNSSGVKGVSFHKPSNKYQAQIRFSGQRKHLGYFDSIADAEIAAKSAREKFHREFARHQKFGEYQYSPVHARFPNFA